MTLKPIIISVFVLSCGACSFDAPSQLDDSRVEIVQSVENSRFETKSLGSELSKSIAQEYTDNGTGDMEVTVTYDPKSKNNTAMKATLEADRIANSLADNGVPRVKTRVMPVANSWNISHTFVSYNSVSAQAPSECGEMLPGFDERKDVGISEKHIDYNYGCTVEAMLANQVAYPADMLGQEDNTDTDSGRRAENVVSGRGYYGSDQYPELSGDTASGN